MTTLQLTLSLPFVATKCSLCGKKCPPHPAALTTVGVGLTLCASCEVTLRSLAALLGEQPLVLHVHNPLDDVATDDQAPEDGTARPVAFSLSELEHAHG